MQWLPSDVIDKISDVLTEHELYNHLKEAILKRTGCSEEDMIQEILQNVTKGDKTPTQLLRYMKNQLGKHMSEKVLHGLRLKCLPKLVTQINRPSDKSHTSGWFGRVRRPSFHPVQPQHKCSSHLAQWSMSSTNRAWQNGHWPTCRDKYGKYRFLCINGQGDQHLPHSNKHPAEKGETTSTFVGFITHLAMKPGTADPPVSTHWLREMIKLESGNDRLIRYQHTMSFSMCGTVGTN